MGERLKGIKGREAGARQAKATRLLGRAAGCCCIKAGPTELINGRESVLSWQGMQGWGRGWQRLAKAKGSVRYVRRALCMLTCATTGNPPSNQLKPVHHQLGGQAGMGEGVAEQAGEARHGVGWEG